MAAKKIRTDHLGAGKTIYQNARKKIIAAQDICGICGLPVNKKLKWPHPLSPTVDHIDPVSKGGASLDMGNMQLAHWICNRKKSDKQAKKVTFEGAAPVVDNRLLPQTFDWKAL
jgi:5-methylcytosine-specific restriction endonuclease McrA